MSVLASTILILGYIAIVIYLGYDVITRNKVYRQEHTLAIRALKKYLGEE